MPETGICGGPFVSEGIVPLSIVLLTDRQGNASYISPLMQHEILPHPSQSIFLPRLSHLRIPYNPTVPITMDAQTLSSTHCDFEDGRGSGPSYGYVSARDAPVNNEDGRGSGPSYGCVIAREALVDYEDGRSSGPSYGCVIA